MKAILSTLLVFALLFALSFCGTFGDAYITDPAKYGKSYYGVSLNNYFPDVIDEYTVNAYSFRIYAFLDICYEAILDISVTEEQFDEIISEVKKIRPEYTEIESYYAEGYSELVFCDRYSIDRSDRANSDIASVYTAKIEKVVYDPESLRIVFVDFDAFDSYVYPLNEVEYFNMFNIDEEEYLHWINVRMFEEAESQANKESHEHLS